LIVTVAEAKASARIRHVATRLRAPNKAATSTGAARVRPKRASRRMTSAIALKEPKATVPPVIGRSGMAAAVADADAADAVAVAVERVAIVKAARWAERPTPAGQKAVDPTTRSALSQALLRRATVTISTVEAKANTTVVMKPRQCVRTSIRTTTSRRLSSAIRRRSSASPLLRRGSHSPRRNSERRRLRRSRVSVRPRARATPHTPAKHRIRASHTLSRSAPSRGQLLRNSSHRRHALPRLQPRVVSLVAELSNRSWCGRQRLRAIAAAITSS
jgi:hypothetical protein